MTTQADRNLALLGSQPQMSMAELRAALPDANPKTVGRTIGGLREVSDEMGIYRLNARPSPAPQPRPVQPQDVCVPMERLMAGR